MDALLESLNLSRYSGVFDDEGMDDPDELRKMLARPHGVIILQDILVKAPYCMKGGHALKLINAFFP